MIEGYANEALVSSGTGKNRGVDITLEKFFSKGWFMLTGFSVFNSTYEPLNGISYNTQYNSRSAGTLTAGRNGNGKGIKRLLLAGNII
jgi:hypothetical protein